MVSIFTKDCNGTTTNLQCRWVTMLLHDLKYTTVCDIPNRSALESKLPDTVALALAFVFIFGSSPFAVVLPSGNFRQKHQVSPLECLNCLKEFFPSEIKWLSATWGNAPPALKSLSVCVQTSCTCQRRSTSATSPGCGPPFPERTACRTAACWVPLAPPG